MDKSNIVVGLDIGRGSAVACAMGERPTDLVQFIRKYRPIVAPANKAGLKAIESLGDIFALEPTGKDQRWWQRELEALGKLVLIVSGTRIRAHAKDSGVQSKGDKEDAAVIASYTKLNLERGNSRAFQAESSNQIKDLRAELLSVQRHRNQISNQLKARFGDEQPELVKFKPTVRAWGESSPKCWQKLQEDYDLSWLAREDISQIIYWNNREAAVEVKLSELLESPSLLRYAPVWEAWQLSYKQAVPILAAIHPLEQFLADDGKRIIEHIHTTTGSRVKTDRTLRGIHRALGYGRIKIQSGDSWRWRRSGDGSTIAAFYMWMEKQIVLRRTPNRNRLKKIFDCPDGELEALSEKAQKKWIEARNFRSYCLSIEPRCETVRPIPRDKQRVGYMPWKDEALINRIAEDYSLVPKRIATMQLFYEWAFFEIGKQDRILKSIPLMIRLLVNDLIDVVK